MSILRYPRRKAFNFTLRFGQVGLRFHGLFRRSACAVVAACVLGKSKPVARNVMEGGFEKRTSKSKRALLLRKE